jgi:hypothetical protein
MTDTDDTDEEDAEADRYRPLIISFPPKPRRLHIFTVTIKARAMFEDLAEHGDDLAADICDGAQRAMDAVARDASLCVSCSAPIAQCQGYLPIVAWSDTQPMLHGCMCRDCLRDRSGLADRALREGLFREIAAEYGQDAGTTGRTVDAAARPPSRVRVRGIPGRGRWAWRR